MIDQRALYWEVMNASGWEYLLPRAARRRWLCLDASRGAIALVLAGLCHELYVVPVDPAASAEIAEKLRVKGVTNARLALDGAYPDADARGPDGFNGFILHDLGGALHRQAVENALRTASRLVSPEGFIYAALRNRYGYTRLLRGWAEMREGGAGSYFSARAVRRLMGGGRETAVYPLISSGNGQVTDVVPPGGYVSVKNPSLPNEYLRRWLLGPHSAPRWSPGFAVLATGDPKARSALACALDTLEAHGCLSTGIAPTTLIKRYHVVNGGKIILSVGKTPGRYGSHIVVLVRSPESTARRRRESGLLSRLAALPADIASRIPRFYYEAEAGGVKVFVLQEFPGVTLDAPVAGLRPATRDAVHFLLRLHIATRQAMPLTTARYCAMFGATLETGRSRYPMLIAELNRLERMLKDTLIGAELPVVWMHGDFKIENIVIDEHSHRLLGVIDWELSDPEGPPLLDLWYLLLYNRQIERGVDFLTAVQGIIPPQELTGDEAALCAEYMQALNVPLRLVPALAGALIAHHAVRRIDYDPKDAAAMDRLRALLDKAVAWSDAGASSASTASGAAHHA